MTDLERVRETLEDLASYPSKPPKRMRELAEAAIPVIDAHLKEDAEREAKWIDKHSDARLELARLREERDKLHALYNRAQDDASREAEIRVNQGFELAKVRERVKYLEGRVPADDVLDAREENARLREALRIIAKNGSYSDALLAAEALRGESDG